MIAKCADQDLNKRPTLSAILDDPWLKDALDAPVDLERLGVHISEKPGKSQSGTNVKRPKKAADQYVTAFDEVP